MDGHETIQRFVYICSFYIPDDKDYSMVVFDNADTMLDFSEELERRGYDIGRLAKCPVVDSIEETLEEVERKTPKR